MKKTLKTVCAVLSLSLATLSLMPLEVEARRLGGGRPAGMQRQMPAKPADTPPAKPATPTQAAPLSPATAPAAVAPARRSWMGPIAGLAAGLGIAALMSHFGMGEGMGNFLTMALVAMLAFVAIRWAMNRFRGAGASSSAPQWAGAGAPMGQGNAGQPGPSSPAAPAWAPAPPMPRASMDAAAPAAALAGSAALPSFDAAGFERIAKLIFVRMQAANDAADVEDLRKFTTPELFASLRLDLQERGASVQQTDVVQLNARVVDTAQEGSQQIASVRFDGLIREVIDGPAEPFDEIWHLVRPNDGSRDWAIAGIAPVN